MKKLRILLEDITTYDINTPGKAVRGEKKKLKPSKILSHGFIAFAPDKRNE